MGILILRHVENVESAAKRLEPVKRDLEQTIREQYGQASRKQLASVHPTDVYVSYYKTFGYSYHVLLQLESVIKGKPIPNVLAPVTAMFVAELKNTVLTAGHDLEKVTFPLQVKRATGNERYTSINGKELSVVPEDILLADQEGVISSILKGPDDRTSIRKQTRHLLFTAYAPSGIEQELVERHLDDIEAYIRMFVPESVTALKLVY
ncbi:phenylalanine--tRNA ligase beta subunit-related protein [Gordoniibacillus kamchatkensis]|nr:phenylalanine--tRNA ligase beta subunit-related protein [Paenibacillus sp. VKM B-2647]